VQMLCNLKFWEGLNLDDGLVICNARQKLCKVVIQYKNEILLITKLDIDFDVLQRLLCRELLPHFEPLWSPAFQPPYMNPKFLELGSRVLFERVVSRDL
jgi:hypothetical protein